VGNASIHGEIIPEMEERFSSEKKWKKFIKKFSIKPVISEKESEIVKKLKDLVVNAVKQNIPQERFGILFSGGVDSSLIAKICKDNKKDFICYTSIFEEKGLKQAEDLEYAKKIAKKFGFKLKIVKANLKQTEKYIKEILKIIKEPNVVKVGVALPFYIAFEAAKKDRINIMFSGLGSEELFAGYKRHTKVTDINKECFNGLIAMYERDITRDLAIAKSKGIKLKIPYLDENIISYSLRIPAKMKFNGKNNKIAIRKVAEKLGLGEFSWRKKRAAQYGSRFDKAIDKLTRKKGFKYKKEYLESVFRGLK